MAETTMHIDSIDLIMGIFGAFDENMKVLEKALDVTVLSRETELKVTGSDPDHVELAMKTIQSLMQLAERGESIGTQTVQYVLGLVKDGRQNQISEIGKDVVCITAKGKPIKAKTLGQKRYMDAMRTHTVTIGIGPAGTGKTYLAVAAAVAAFRDKQISRIILTRPAVEAGEKLGFLPGDLQNKVDPYLRPLYDGLFDMMGAETFNKLLERGSIEVAPLAYMRGRTLDDSFIILDEAQNTTPEQMKMFLTRIGFGSKAVVTGDITQIDLPGDRVSGLKEAVRVLKNVEDIAQCQLTDKDVVRHELVQRIVRAYEKYEQQKQLRAKESAAKRRTQNRK